MRYFFKNPDLYVDAIVGDQLPADAVEISEDLWRDCQTYQWELGGDGLPVPIKVQAPSMEEIAAQEMRAARNLQLQRTDYLELPSVHARLSEGQRVEILGYRQELRDLTSITGFPFCQLPDPPGWLKK
ncbi:phage tail assembly chaperone [Achromobacter ruhlandii]|uniref:phage tail assembly chaperone n=1 Tax=Achromobacter ruhlandii TaxID=72557 RepID=UPI000C267B11|nr:phage tail assembly chaperone [Achromobacter ruhlandii]PJM69198.1 hypothetical protein CV751_15320 [Achromobacter ruhlandii]